jgi:hypothetical protein
MVMSELIDTAIADSSARRRPARPGRRVIVGVAVSALALGAGITAASASRGPEARGRLAEHETLHHGQHARRHHLHPATTVLSEPQPAPIQPPTTVVSPADVPVPVPSTIVIQPPAVGTAPRGVTSSTTLQTADDHGVDPAGHDANDDHGVDGVNHDTNDDHGHDSAGHDANDDHNSSGSGGSGGSGNTSSGNSGPGKG